MKKLALTLALLGMAGGVYAAQVTYQFTGTTSSAMNVNNGSSTGSIPAGTPYSGTLTFDDAQTATPVTFYGGTHSTYGFTAMTLTVGATTVSWGPGIIDVYDNVTSTAGGYPIGDSFYANVSSAVPPNGAINGDSVQLGVSRSGRQHGHGLHRLGAAGQPEPGEFSESIHRVQLRYIGYPLGRRQHIDPSVSLGPEPDGRLAGAAADHHHHIACLTA